MEHTVTISSKGQITLPAEFRRTLGMRQGDKVSIVKRTNSIEIKASSYDQELAELRKHAEAVMKQNGTWGTPWEEVKTRTDEARLKGYQAKYGPRA